MTYFRLAGYFINGKHNVNLIHINWEKASLTYDYFTARRHVITVGLFTTKFIDTLIAHNLLNLDTLHIVGFSLGAHVAGVGNVSSFCSFLFVNFIPNRTNFFSNLFIVGKNLKSGKLRKITGLDPAGPFYSYDKPLERLNDNDAYYVETIHTSKLGFTKPIGNVR